jgi:cell division protein FtsN
MKSQRGGFLLGLVVGLLAGLAVALGVALYITKAPVPFVNKVPQRTAEQDSAEAERNRHWDPNAPLGTKATPRPAAPTASEPRAVATTPAPAPAASRPAPARDAAAILAGGAAPAAAPAASKPGAKSTVPAAEAFVYHVQVGAFTRAEDAEQQRAKMAMLGMESKVSEREQSGRAVYRVRVGPFATREEAEGAQARLTNIGIDARLVRVEKP